LFFLNLAVSVVLHSTHCSAVVGLAAHLRSEYINNIYIFLNVSVPEVARPSNI
jgi:hypothetical protein